MAADRVLKEHKTRDPDTVSALTLSHRALTDVSFLSHHSNNLEKLDLCFNSLSSLEGLESCVNLKWLSVSQNKLQSLRGVEGLSKLHVLNAGKNKLRSMDEVKGLVSLRALILNDNEIGSICRLYQMKELNTLVLSRNPVRNIGKSLAKVNKITKLSLSECQLEGIGASLKSCSKLKELRLSHNDIKVLPAELAHNMKLQNLDLGNNLLTKASDLKVLKSLRKLKNLNLRGNPVVEKPKLLQKVQNLVPNLQVFNAKPMDRSNRSRKSDRVSGSLLDSDGENTEKQTKKGKASRQNVKNLSADCRSHEEEVPNELKEKKQKRHKSCGDEQHQKKNVSVKKEDDSVGGGRLQGGSNGGMGEMDVFDDGEISFLELFAGDTRGHPNDIGKKREGSTREEGNNSAGDLVGPAPPKRNKRRNHRNSPEPEFFATDSIGLGGPSTWGDQ